METIDQIAPKACGLRPFDHQMAVLAGIRSGQVRRERAGLKPASEPARVEVNVVQQAINAQLNLVKEQITRTRAVLNDDHAEYCAECERGGIQPHHRAQLLKALDSLLDRQRKLLGIPDPGPRKPRDDSDRKPATSAWLSEATAIEVAQVPVVAPPAPTVPTSEPAPASCQTSGQTDTPTGSAPKDLTQTQPASV